MTIETEDLIDIFDASWLNEKGKDELIVRLIEARGEEWQKDKQKIIYIGMLFSWF